MAQKGLTTIFHERYLPKDKEIIYHYCPEAAFWSICKNQTMWHSDILELNDSYEYEWGREKFIEVLKKHKNEFTQEFRMMIIMIIYDSDTHIKPCICSFSRRGDLLSQWRAYAKDGKGYSIGFLAKNIYEDLGANINSVIYSESKQKKLILDTLKGLFATWNVDKKLFYEIAIPFGFDLAYFKNPTFFEEKEIRTIRLLRKNGADLIDPGGNSHKKKVSPQQVLKRKTRKAEIAYVDLPVIKGGSSFIKEVIIGPKNTSSIQTVNRKLGLLGLGSIVVKKSTSTYR